MRRMNNQYHLFMGSDSLIDKVSDIKEWLVSSSDDKKLSLGQDAINWNSL